MKILLFGKTSQLALAFVSELKSQNFEVIHPRLDWYDFDQVESYLNSEIFDALINCVAYTQVDKAEDDQNKAHKINCELPHLIAQNCKSKDKGLIHFSTDYVFGDLKEGYRREMDSPNPLNVYGKTKWEGENRILEEGGKGCIIRTSWVYSDIGANFLNTMLRLSDKETLNIVNDQIGVPTSTYFLAREVSGFLKSLIQKKIDVYHLVPQGRTSWFEFAQSIFSIGNEIGLINHIPNLKGIPTSEYPTPALRPLNSLMSCETWCRMVNRSLPSWQEGLVEVMKRKVTS